MPQYVWVILSDDEVIASIRDVANVLPFFIDLRRQGINTRRLRARKVYLR